LDCSSNMLSFFRLSTVCYIASPKRALITLLPDPNDVDANAWRGRDRRNAIASRRPVVREPPRRIATVPLALPPFLVPPNRLCKARRRPPRPPARAVDAH